MKHAESRHHQDATRGPGGQARATTKRASAASLFLTGRLFVRQEFESADKNRVGLSFRALFPNLQFRSQFRESRPGSAASRRRSGWLNQKMNRAPMARLLLNSPT